MNTFDLPNTEGACFALALEHCSARLSFEAWITSPPYQKCVARNSSDEMKSAWPGQYRTYEVQLAWEAWSKSAHWLAATLK